MIPRIRLTITAVSELRKETFVCSVIRNVLPSEPVETLTIVPRENATTNGQAATKPSPDMPSKDVEKSVAIQKIGRLKVIAHLVTTLNIAASFCCSPWLCSSAMVGANMALKDACGIKMKPLILIAAAYCPSATFEIAKYASSNVSIDSSTVSITAVIRFGAAKPNQLPSS